jgi:ATP-dependent DNA ligase
MALEVPLSLEPMEAEPVDALPPAGETWQYEPKVDGFRCIAFRDGEVVSLQSRRQKPLARYFPEIAEAAIKLPRRRFVIDGELVIPDQPFDTLQLRLHPAASRIARLSREHPAQFVAFDLLTDADGQSMLSLAFAHRRAALEQFFDEISDNPHFMLSKATRSTSIARMWLKNVGHGLDGIVAKRLDQPYRPGQRAMLKYKVWKTVDCVVGGVYYRKGTQDVEYLLLGLFDDAGLLHYVGRCGVGEKAREFSQLLQPLLGGPGFTGNAPAGKSRWNSRERKPIPLQLKLVAEVSADHVEGGRFRHGSRLLRWRTDKRPEDCMMDQVMAHRSDRTSQAVNTEG